MQEYFTVKACFWLRREELNVLYDFLLVDCNQLLFKRVFVFCSRLSMIKIACEVKLHDFLSEISDVKRDCNDLFTFY